MKPKTMILMVVAVGCGLGASYMTSKLLADRGAKPQEVQTVPVLVAKVRVPGWQQLKEPEKLFELKMFPVDVAPKRAIGNIADLKDQRLNKPLDESKAVTLDDLLTKEQQTIADQLQPGQRAVAFKVTAESLAGGFVLPGSRVDIICTTRGNDPTSRVVLQNMLVMACDMNSTRNPDQQSMIAQTVTVAATTTEATRLTLASEVGVLRLTVKGHGDTTNVVTAPMTMADLNKPINQSNEPEKAPETTPTPPAGGTTNVLPQFPADDKAAPIEEPVVVKPVQRRRHVMTIQNGTQREKAIFTEGEDEDVTSSDPDRAEATREERAEQPRAAEKPADRPAAPPAGGSSGTRTGSTKTKRIQ